MLKWDLKCVFFSLVLFCDKLFSCTGSSNGDFLGVFLIVEGHKIFFCFKFPHEGLKGI